MWNSHQETPEVRVMRLCCRYALDEIDITDCRSALILLLAQLDEADFLEGLHHQRLLLLVYQVLSTDFKVHVSSDLMTALSQEAHVILKRQLVLMALERDIDQAFKSENIPYFFLKGPMLNRTLWGRRMMRYSGDLDVLVLPADMITADAALRAIDYYPNISKRKLRVSQLIHRWSTEKDISYYKKKSFGFIELHWKTHYIEFIFKPNHVREQLLDDENYVLYLCLHAAKHGWSRLIWLVDIIAFLKAKKLDILHVRALGKKKHIEPVVDEAILLAKKWLGIELQDDVFLGQLKNRSSILEKRLQWAEQRDAKRSLLNSTRWLLSSHFFCSNVFYQLYLWGVCFWDAIKIKLSKRLKATHA
ncbi:MAG: nucleotidyltransferase family protein [Gammaproteobacteria bacterium]|nr:nucleotidyltransferase family protein [Gammaproteobacteria bacterium]MCH9715984.1 nucleotidyltransferase family protein [Gammaproteobacteria bacterium]MCH9763103.1 nucleotidyltransferase family protein [Gammaproteobacteria bacterium]